MIQIIEKKEGSTVVTKAINNLTPYEILTEISKITDLYAFIGALAKYVSIHDGECNRYTQWVESQELPGRTIRKDLDSWMDMAQKIASARIEDIIDAWVETVVDDIVNLHLYCLFTVLFFDKNTIETNTTGNIKEITGPLDSTSSSCFGFHVYKKPPRWFQEDYFEKHGIRHNRNLQDYICCNSLKEIKNYIFVDGEQLGQKEVMVIKYNPPFSVAEDTFLKILLCPISNEKWFSYKCDDINDSFRVYYPNDDFNRAVNKKICQVIEFAAKNHIRIVAFPEITLNSTTVEEVRSFLEAHENIKDEVVLIYLGTYWRDIGHGGVNEGTVLSGSGTIIYEAIKKWKFDFYDEEKEKTYKEDLADTGRIFYFLDILGWGRISWEICIEFLRDSHKACYPLGTNIQIVSSYSSKVDEMENRANGDCNEYGSITAFVNYCMKAEPEGQYCSFLSAPLIETKRAIRCKMAKGIIDCAEDCLGCSCGFLYSISKNMIVNTQQVGD